jgi:replicative DNA helicase
MPQELGTLHDPNLEATLLHAVITYPDHLLEDWSYLPDEVFYRENHRKVWREIRRQHNEYGGLDLVTLATAFHERGETEAFNDALLRILGVAGGEYAPSSFYAPVYAHRLKRYYVRREKATAVRAYEAKINVNPDDADARLELEMILHVLDGMLQDETDRSDEELAREMGGDGRYSTGFQAIDSLTGGFARPGLNIVAARPSVGKSSFARAVIRKAAQRGDRILWYSKDQSENQIMELEIARALKIDSNRVRTLELERRLAGIKHVRQEVWNGNVTLIDRPIPLPQLLTVAKTEQPHLIVIDYIQILDTGLDDEYESITAASKALKTLAFQLRVPILALAQFNRAHQPGKPPSMANLRGSGQLEQDADQIYALDRDTTLHTTSSQEAKLHVLKNKTGGAGVVTLSWVGRYAEYAPAAREHETRFEGYQP